MPLADIFIRVRLIRSFIFLVDTVICQMHEFVAQSLHRSGIPLKQGDKNKCHKITNFLSHFTL